MLIFLPAATSTTDVERADSIMARSKSQSSLAEAVYTNATGFTLVDRRLATGAGSIYEGSIPSCTFFAETSQRYVRIILAQWERRSKIFGRVVHKSTGGILKPIPEPVDPVGNAFLYGLMVSGNMNTAALLGVPVSLCVWSA